jgi:hypothetical protein
MDELEAGWARHWPMCCATSTRWTPPEMPAQFIKAFQEAAAIPEILKLCSVRERETSAFGLAARVYFHR